MNGGGRPPRSPVGLTLASFLLDALAVLALVGFLLVTSAQEPIEHSTNGGDRPA